MKPTIRKSARQTAKSRPNNTSYKKSISPVIHKKKYLSAKNAQRNKKRVLQSALDIIVAENLRCNLLTMVPYVNMQGAQINMQNYLRPSSPVQVEEVPSTSRTRRGTPARFTGTRITRRQLRGNKQEIIDLVSDSDYEDLTEKQSDSDEKSENREIVNRRRRPRREKTPETTDFADDTTEMECLDVWESEEEVPKKNGKSKRVTLPETDSEIEASENEAPDESEEEVVPKKNGRSNRSKTPEAHSEDDTQEKEGSDAESEVIVPKKKGKSKRSKTPEALSEDDTQEKEVSDAESEIIVPKKKGKSKGSKTPEALSEDDTQEKEVSDAESEIIVPKKKEKFKRVKSTEADSEFDTLQEAAPNEATEEAIDKPRKDVRKLRARNVITPTRSTQRLRKAPKKYADEEDQVVVKAKRQRTPRAASEEKEDEDEEVEVERSTAPRKLEIPSTLNKTCESSDDLLAKPKKKRIRRLSDDKNTSWIMTTNDGSKRRKVDKGETLKNGQSEEEGVSVEITVEEVLDTALPAEEVIENGNITVPLDTSSVEDVAQKEVVEEPPEEQNEEEQPLPQSQVGEAEDDSITLAANSVPTTDENPPEEEEKSSEKEDEEEIADEDQSQEDEEPKKKDDTDKDEGGDGDGGDTSQNGNTAEDSTTDEQPHNTDHHDKDAGGGGDDPNRELLEILTGLDDASDDLNSSNCTLAAKQKASKKVAAETIKLIRSISGASSSGSDSEDKENGQAKKVPVQQFQVHRVELGLKEKNHQLPNVNQETKTAQQKRCPFKIRFKNFDVKFQCSECKKAFSRNADLQLHSFKHMDPRVLSVRVFRAMLPRVYDTATGDEERYLRPRKRYHLSEEGMNLGRSLVEKYCADNSLLDAFIPDSPPQQKKPCVTMLSNIQVSPATKSSAETLEVASEIFEVDISKAHRERQSMEEETDTEQMVAAEDGNQNTLELLAEEEEEDTGPAVEEEAKSSGSEVFEDSMMELLDTDHATSTLPKAVVESKSDSGEDFKSVTSSPGNFNTCPMSIADDDEDIDDLMRDMPLMSDLERLDKQMKALLNRSINEK